MGFGAEGLGIGVLCRLRELSENVLLQVQVASRIAQLRVFCDPFCLLKALRFQSVCPKRLIQP